MVDCADTTRASPLGTAADGNVSPEGIRGDRKEEEQNRQAAKSRQRFLITKFDPYFLASAGGFGGSSSAFDVTTPLRHFNRPGNQWLSCFCARSYLGPLVLVNSSCLRIS